MAVDRTIQDVNIRDVPVSSTYTVSRSELVRAGDLPRPPKTNILVSWLAIPCPDLADGAGSIRWNTYHLRSDD